MSPLKRSLSLLIGIVLGIVVPVWILGATAEHWLFNRVSYTNSPAFDAKLRALSAGSWNIVATGSSEVRWGISPDDLDAGFAERPGGPAAHSFNAGLDGFSPGLMYMLLKNSKIIPQGSGTKVLLIGVNFAEPVSVGHLSYTPGACGDMQKPIFESAFGGDNGLNIFCKESNPLSPVALIERIPLFRYRKAIRDLLTGQETARPDTRDHPNGFHAHAPASSEGNYYSVFEADLPRMRQSEPERFTALDPGNWQESVSEGGMFESYRLLAKERGWLPVFFVLPTNPVFYRAFGREQSLAENIALIRQWSEQTGTVFIDLGIKEDYDPLNDFADFRHLSESGAKKYSRELGRALAADPRVSAALER